MQMLNTMHRKSVVSFFFGFSSALTNMAQHACFSLTRTFTSRNNKNMRIQEIKKLHNYDLNCVIFLLDHQLYINVLISAVNLTYSAVEED